MKNLIKITFFFLFNSFTIANNIYSDLTGGKCTTLSCYNAHTIEELSGGKCTTMSCYNKQMIQELSGGKCETISCYCSLYPCPVGRSYDYNVSGYGNGEYVSGNIDASEGSHDVDEYLTLDDGTEVSFDGE